LCIRQIHRIIGQLDLYNLRTLYDLMLYQEIHQTHKYPHLMIKEKLIFS